MTSLSARAGTWKNIRPTRRVNVLYWMVFYTYTFLVATKYFVFEQSVVQPSFFQATIWQHAALILSIVVGFALLRHRALRLPKKILSTVAVPVLLVGAILPQVRTHVAYLVVLAVLLGQLATCSLLTYIYEMNNAERLFGIVGCHLMVAIVAVYTVFFSRETGAFWWLILALATVAATLGWLERPDKVDAEVVCVETFSPRLYVPLLLACVGGVASVFSSMAMVEQANKAVPSTPTRAAPVNKGNAALFNYTSSFMELMQSTAFSVREEVTVLSRKAIRYYLEDDTYAEYGITMTTELVVDVGTGLILQMAQLNETEGESYGYTLVCYNFATPYEVELP